MKFIDKNKRQIGVNRGWKSVGDILKEEYPQERFQNMSRTRNKGITNAEALSILESVEDGEVCFTKKNGRTIRAKRTELIMPKNDTEEKLFYR